MKERDSFDASAVAATTMPPSTSGLKKTNDESSVGIHGGKDAWEDNELQTKLKIANIRHSISECTLGSLMKCPLLAIRVSR